MEQAEPTWQGMVRLSDGYERFVTKFGDGPEVLIGLHGGPGGSMFSLLPLGRIGDDRFTVVLYDQIEGGKSERPGRDDLLTVEAFVGEFEDLVATMDLGPVHLLGHSWGGMLALECAVRCPGLVRTLLLCNTLAATETAVAGYKQLIATAPPEVRDELEGGSFDLEDDSPAARAMLELSATHAYRTRPFDLERSCREFVELLKPVIAEGGRAYQVMWGENDFSATGTLRDWDVRDRLAEIAAPTLVVCGLHDEVVPACSQEMAEGIPDAQWLILGQSSHLVFHEAERDVLLGAIRAFIS